MGELNGIWNSRYVYSGGESHHQIEIDDTVGPISVESLPNEEGSELRMKLTRDENLIGGSWSEKTSPTGTYEGAVFKGHVDFVLDAAFTRAEGIWTGHNRDKSKINSGEWSLEKKE